MQPFLLHGCLHPTDLLSYFTLGCNALHVHRPPKHAVMLDSKLTMQWSGSKKTPICHLCLLQGLRSAATRRPDKHCNGTSPKV